MKNNLEKKLRDRIADFPIHLGKNTVDVLVELLLIEVDSLIKEEIGNSTIKSKPSRTPQSPLREQFNLYCKVMFDAQKLKMDREDVSDWWLSKLQDQQEQIYRELIRELIKNAEEARILDSSGNHKETFSFVRLEEVCHLLGDTNAT